MRLLTPFFLLLTPILNYTHLASADDVICVDQEKTDTAEVFRGRCSSETECSVLFIKQKDTYKQNLMTVCSIIKNESKNDSVAAKAPTSGRARPTDEKDVCTSACFGRDIGIFKEKVYCSRQWGKQRTIPEQARDRVEAFRQCRELGCFIETSIICDSSTGEHGEAKDAYSVSDKASGWTKKDRAVSVPVHGPANAESGQNSFKRQ